MSRTKNYIENEMAQGNDVLNSLINDVDDIDLDYYQLIEDLSENKVTSNEFAKV